MSPSMQLSCRECGRALVFTSGEAAFYASRGFDRPRRRPPCRAARKAGQTSSSAADAVEANRRRDIFRAICASCGQDAVVPFEPEPGHQVWCSRCFTRRPGLARNKSQECS